jgi:hypothetical protein
MTKNSLVILPEQFQTDSIKYSDIKILSNGGKSVYVSHGGNLLVMQTPKMSCPYGLSKYEEPGKPPKYNLDLSFRNKEDSEALNNLYTMLEKFDEKLVNDASANALSWFKKKSVSKDALRELYTPMVKLARDKDTLEVSDKYPPTFKVKIPYRDGVFQCDVYNSKREKLTNCNLEELLTKGTKVQLLVQCMGLWFAGGKFGCSWKVIQLKIDESPSKISGYSFIEDGDAEEEETEDVVQEDSDEEP